MTRSSEQTKRRLLDAAVVEFAEHGLSGARTSRIAAAAGANEALIFRYFDSKSALFEQVFTGLVTQTLDDVPFDASDLPDYAGRLFDYYQDHRAVLRIALHAALEAEARPLPAVIGAFRAKVTQVRRAQQAGRVGSALPASELVSVVVHLSISGSDISVVTEPGPVDRAARRASVVATVAAMVTAPSR